VKDLLSNVGSGGGAPVAAGGAPAAGGGGAPAAEAEAEKPKEEEKEESDDDMVSGLLRYLVSARADGLRRASVCSIRGMQMVFELLLLYSLCIALYPISFCTHHMPPAFLTNGCVFVSIEGIFHLEVNIGQPAAGA
jgi:hypothetical protein